MNDKRETGFVSDPRDLTQLGFKSHATEYIGQVLSLDQRFIQNKPATYFWWVKGGEHRILGLKDGDLAVIDTSLEPRHGSLAVYVVENRRFLIRRLRRIGPHLIPVSLKQPNVIDPLVDEDIFGVIRALVREFRDADGPHRL